MDNQTLEEILALEAQVKALTKHLYEQQKAAHDAIVSGDNRYDRLRELAQRVVNERILYGRRMLVDSPSIDALDAELNEEK